MVSQKKILITGASGFIGRKATDYALRNGYAVVGFDMGNIEESNKNFKFVKGSVNDRDALRNAAKGCDYILHLAAQTSLPDFNADLHANYTTNILGFMNAIDAARENGCKKFAYASSSAVYLDKFSEESVIDVTKLRNHYGKSKLIDDMIADSYIDTYKMGVVGFRYFNIYGPGERSKFRSSPITQFLLEKRKTDTITIFGDGKQSKDFTYIEDAVKITFMLMESEKSSGVYNVGTGISTSFNQVAKLMKPKKIAYVKNPYLATYMFYLKADTKRLMNVIGKYKFVSLIDGIKKTEAAL